MMQLQPIDNDIILSEKQMQIVTNNTYPQYIKAGAGTGKTETLIQKIVYILENNPDISLNNISIISFTNKATDEMKMRLSKCLYKQSLIHLSNGNQELYKKLKNDAYLVNISSVSTIHSFCEDLLRKYGLVIGVSPNYKVSSYLKNVDEEISSIIRQLYKNNEITEIKENTLRSLIYDIYRKNNNKGIYEVDNTYDSINTTLGKIRKKFINIYNQVVKNTEIYKHDNNVLSINDSLQATVRLLKKEPIRKQLKKQLKYVFIDEYQDTNIPQFELTKELIEIGINVFLVGDERQAIYNFRGADIYNSKRMSKYIENFNISNNSLNENFRSDPELIRTINKIFKKDILFNGKTVEFDKTPLLIPDSNRESEVEPICITNGKDIVAIIKDIIKNKTLSGKKVEYNDISILCRKNYIVDNIAEKCKQANIPIEVMGGHGFYKAKEIIDIYRFLNYIIYKREVYKNELFLTDAYKSFKISNSGNFNVFLEELCDYSKNTTMELVLDYIIEKTNIDLFYMDNKRYQAIANLSKLRAMAYNSTKSTFMSSLAFLEFISPKIISEAEEDEAPVSDENRKKGVVSVYTIHKAKGLSFPIVIISNMDAPLINPNKFPKAIMKCKDGKTAIGFSEKIIGMQDIQYEKLLDQHIIDMLEEELRILYVACTRAKHMLILSCEKEAVNSKATNWINWVNKSRNNNIK